MSRRAVSARELDGTGRRNQWLALRAVAEQRGWIIVTENVDEGISARRDGQAPQLDAMCVMRRGPLRRSDGWALYRIGRSLRDSIDTSHELEKRARRPVPASASHRHNDASRAHVATRSAAHSRSSSEA